MPPGFPRAPAARIGGNHDQRERQEPRAQECSRLGGSLTLDEASATPPESARRAGLKYWRTPARSACGVFGDLVRVECQEIRCGQEKWATCRQDANFAPHTVLLAAVFNLLGALLVGAAVANTIAGIVTVLPGHAVAVIGSCALRAVLWNLLPADQHHQREQTAQDEVHHEPKHAQPRNDAKGQSYRPDRTSPHRALTQFLNPTSSPIVDEVVCRRTEARRGNRSLGRSSDVLVRAVRVERVSGGAGCRRAGGARGCPARGAGSRPSGCLRSRARPARAPGSGPGSRAHPGGRRPRARH